MIEQIEKYFLNELTSAQKDELFRQMANNPDLRDEFTRVQNSWALASMSGSGNDRHKAGRYYHEFKKRLNRKKATTFFTGLTKYAAILVAGILIAKVLFHKQQDIEMPVAVNQTLTVPAGNRARLVLADGTAVWVNAKSTLEYPSVFTGDSRDVTISGEAFFDVTANPAQPFIVKSGNFRTQVTGTQFNVFAYDGFYDVSLVEGQVKVYKEGAVKDTVRLNRNEKATLINGQFVKKTSGSMDDFLWREGIYWFDDMPFDAVIEKLQLYYDVQIHIANKGLLKRRYTGKFRQRDGIESVLKVIQMDYPFVFSKSEDGSQIYIK